MGRMIPIATMQPMGSLLPDCIALVEGKSFEITTSSSGKLAYKTQAVVVEPEELAGQILFDDFYIGSDDDPEATQPETFQKSFGGKRFRSMCDASGITDQLAGAEEVDEESMPGYYVGARYLASVTLQKQPELNKDGSPNPYAGNESNNVKRYWPVGERDPMVVAKPAGSPAAKPQAPKPAAPKPAPTPTKAAAPAPAKAQAPKPAPAKAAAAPAGEKMIPCSACGEKVAVSQFQAHVMEKHADE